MVPHVDMLGMLFIVWGLLTTLVGVSTLALGVGAVALITSANRSEGGQFAAGLTAAIFTTLAIIAIVWGAAHVAVGVPLRRRRPWSPLASNRHVPQRARAFSNTSWSDALRLMRS